MAYIWFLTTLIFFILWYDSRGNSVVKDASYFWQAVKSFFRNILKRFKDE